MGFKKSEISQLNSLASAIKLIEFEALLQIVGGDKLIIPFC
ncbi:Uncharacterised protein [Klebsiella pneumoniae]|nr:Uncharacterised protein [Klebsiella pneumoniae]